MSDDVREAMRQLLWTPTATLTEHQQRIFAVLSQHRFAWVTECHCQCGLFCNRGGHDAHLAQLLSEVCRAQYPLTEEEREEIRKVLLRPRSTREELADVPEMSAQPVVTGTYHVSIPARDQLAHARIDALQCELAYALAEIKLATMPAHPGVALNSKSWYEDYLATFKESDRHAQSKEA